nr:PREDICTED: uncharacterized protein LOC105678238 [Linepithema humile]
MTSPNETAGTMEQRRGAARRGAWAEGLTVHFQHETSTYVKSMCRQWMKRISCRHLEAKIFSRQRITTVTRRSRDLLKIAGCVTPARRVFARFTLAAKENERNGAGQVPAGGDRSAPASRHEDSKKVRRGRLNSRRELQRASRSSHAVSFRGDRSASVSIALRRRNADEGIISRRERSRGAKIDHVAMVSPSGTERPGPAPLIPPADQKGKKRNDEVPTHAARYLTGQSISLSREIIPGGGGESCIRCPDNYPRVIV